MHTEHSLHTKTYGKSLLNTFLSLSIKHAVLFLSLLQFCRRGGACLHSPGHQLHEGPSSHRRSEGVQASERAIPGPSRAHQTSPRAQLSWSTAARYTIGWDSFNTTRLHVCCMFLTCFPTMTQVNLLSTCSSSLWSLETSHVASPTWRSFWIFSHLTNMCR